VAVADALIDGRDPLADQTVRHQLDVKVLNASGIGDQVQEFAWKRATEAVTEHADALVKSWRTPFTKAAKAMTDAAATIGDHSLDDSAGILRLGGRAADTWAAAQNAQTTIAAIITGWLALAMVVRRSPVNRDQRALIVADLEPDTWRDLDRDVSAWDLARAGHPLSLATLDEHRDRVARATTPKSSTVTKRWDGVRVA
jgi:hypothetical protein